MKKFKLIVALILLTSIISLPLIAKPIFGKSFVEVKENQSKSLSTNLGLNGGWPREIAIDPTNPNNVYIITKSPNGLFWTNNGGTTWRGLPAGTDYGEGVDVAVNSSNGDVYATVGNNLIKSTNDGSSWTKLGVNEQNFVTGFLVYAQNKLFMASSDGKVRISADGGATFSVSTVTSTDTLWDIDAASDGTLYATSTPLNPTSWELYKSINGGNSWNPMNISTAGVSAAISKVKVNPNDPTHIVLAGSSAFQTRDSGTSWTQCSASGATINFDSAARLYIGHYFADSSDYTNFSSLTAATTSGTSMSSSAYIVDPTNPNIIYGDSSAGMAKSTDRGTTWADINEGITAVTVNDISQANNKNIAWAATFSGLAKSTNFTSSNPTWTFPIAVDGNTSPDSVWVKPDDGNTVVACIRGKVYKTTNGGASWQQSSTPDLPTNDNIYQIINKPGNNNTLYAAFAFGDQSADKTGGVLKSIDAGSTWTNMNLTNNAPAQSITADKNGNLYVGTGSPAHWTIKIRGIYKYNGSSWSKLSHSPNYEVPAVLVDPENPNVIYAGAGDTNSNSAYFYKSSDSGSNWTKITSGLSGLRLASSLAINKATTPNTLYLGGQNQYSNSAIYKSMDSGETFGSIYSGLESETFNTLLFDGLVGGNNRGLYDVKSKASLGLKASSKRVVRGSKIKLTVTLKDSLTTKKKVKRRTVTKQKVLKNRIVYLFVKVKNKKKTYKLKTNKSGIGATNIKINKNSTIWASWTPKSKADKAEYASVKTKNTSLKVQ